MSTKITAERVRYIKLGSRGDKEAWCFSNNFIYIGFGSDKHFPLCINNDWDGLIGAYRAEGRSKPTQARNQVKTFFDDDGSILWVTFSGQKMWWAFVDPSQTPQAIDGGSTRLVRGTWNDKDICGRELAIERISGHLSQLVGYRATSCNVKDIDYVLRLINDEPDSDAITAQAQIIALKSTILKLIQKLQPADFELLVDILFTQSGWRRFSPLGETQKTIDMAVILPTTGERAIIQVKSRAEQRDLDEEYMPAFRQMQQFGKMFFVYHSGYITSDNPAIRLIGPDDISDLVINSGLMMWVVDRVK